MKSVMKHQFSQVPKADIPRSVFNRTHGYKTTFDAGYLIPFYVDEALPGDTFNFKASIFGRLATPIVPIMDNMFLDTFYFAVPMRLVWDNFQKMMGEQIDPGDSTDYLIPQITAPAGGWDLGTISDYFGLPTGIDGVTTSTLWHRAYNLIYNDWFRDQNLQDSLPVPRDDGPDDPADYVLQRRGKRHDYFTSALPWPQKGPGVELPLGTTAPVVSTGESIYLQQSTGGDRIVQGAYSTTNRVIVSGTPVFTGGEMFFGSQSGLEADLTNATAASINSLRQAFQLQKLFERDARGGTRYVEMIKSHFGVTSPDYRLQRPEYLGGDSIPINITPVQQTGETNTTPLGTLAAYGTFGNGGSDGFNKSFTEHMLIIGIASVRADLTYQQGIPRMFSRQTRFDHYVPALSHLGEQSILNKEIYFQNTAADDEVFGYQERWAEYRYYPSKITGEFRSTSAQTLDNWHLSQEFSSLPTLSATFIEDTPPVDRVIAVTNEPQFLFDSYIRLKCARPMPTYSVPGLIDHF